MIIFKTVDQLQMHLDKCRKNGMTIGFVPTMGALHDGHLSLVKNSKSGDGLTVCSIFVNPEQFNDPKDYEKYPVTIEQDIYKLESNDCDILFLPSTNEIYPQDADRKKHFELGYLEEILEGKWRPGHFRGVCLVVEKLLEIVDPDVFYLGQKDYQQCLVIKRLIGLMEMDDKIELKISPTVREKDGLAMSSRNLRLNAEERAKANTIYKTLQFVKNNASTLPLTELGKQATSRLEEKSFKVDYIEIADAKTLKPIQKFDPQIKTVAVVAAYLNDVRLIDNMMLND
jgi:pantoate--beta-alanine ligase